MMNNKTNERELNIKDLANVNGGVTVELISRDKILNDFAIENPDYKPRTVIQGVPEYISKIKPDRTFKMRENYGYHKRRKTPDL